MAITRSRYRTATSAGTLVAFLLVLIFGSPWYVDWVNSGNRGLFLETLAWPAWNFDTDQSVRDLLAADLKAILLVLFTAVFITLLVGAQLASARGTISAILTGWAAYIFAAALAALITAFLLADASISSAVVNAAGGAGYGLIVGWIIGLASMAGRRP
ncbi:hypothetical protein Daura_02800 [Dactylosporangium aurantiacum]|uniref:Uncharacterized protein n=1 Tax=Dactylosporangium aurantiacum TaxID=35754 RepID=A0A9Q9IGP1_9ACTN|nr:hypothetical protein [Dactylosporangium aurantiacum]MDG6100708.1 hypothetical protein [Dactylosporangium aurantiacum]UWZ55221.1 hypothetical protein Daura_02800 [Dactylosporangium aurantiacum]